MVHRRPLVVANWKMNGSLATIRPLVAGLGAGLKPDCEAEVVVCAPYVYLGELAEGLLDLEIVGGAQNVSHEQAGAFTGEVSAEMLRDFSCAYVIVGHSERRLLYAETDTLIATKFGRVQAAGLQPILCVGEQLEERQRGDAEAVIKQQLRTVIETAGIAALSQAVIAYEPVWAIGTGETASPQQAQEMHAFIRLLLRGYDATVAAEIRLIYGGSVKVSNAEEIFAMADVDGGLIGGASLDRAEFLNICHIF